MWGKPESPKRSSSTFQASSSETTYIAADAEFNGKLTLKGNARIDGKIDGHIILSGDLIIGPSAVIDANIKASAISISGEVRGDIVAQETLELCSSARMKGNIFSKQLKIDQGAQFIGTSRLLEDAKQITHAAEEASAAASPDKEAETDMDMDMDMDMDDILKPLDPLEEEQTESSSDNSSLSKNLAYGKSKSRRR
ncbi:MAG TPA: polymer-forming cytoskeletal protein [Desulfitobacterium dehalogenans]|uniref:Polymer-forming cytoskeletal protein n=1 Tax=Desulfitobacterium dehalogenans TaxID=36854 RepID=A0A7C7D8R1_9FIRM|nr:polymer-forming cytoskeletal protein [Desulfitobacterium dehalogenans]